MNIKDPVCRAYHNRWHRRLSQWFTSFMKDVAVTIAIVFGALVTIGTAVVAIASTIAIFLIPILTVFAILKYLF